MLSANRFAAILFCQALSSGEIVSVCGSGHQRARASVYSGATLLVELVRACRLPNGLLQGQLRLDPAVVYA